MVMAGKTGVVHYLDGRQGIAQALRELGELVERGEVSCVVLLGVSTGRASFDRLAGSLVHVDQLLGVLTRYQGRLARLADEKVTDTPPSGG